ncbi:MAG: hypothetical protein FRX48_02208 [Lasallia pustulata]|uniref:Uncharacterized protein n=1 Tax=Lasallia pustulata TaxID=136370 RepID=A0A5M8PXQ8_9LECA|nr:MAG: hypothetical protein FRX48_02208 [Lasallia pustulata]
MTRRSAWLCIHRVPLGRLLMDRNRTVIPSFPSRLTRPVLLLCAGSRNEPGRGTENEAIVISQRFKVLGLSKQTTTAGPGPAQAPNSTLPTPQSRDSNTPQPRRLVISTT